MENSNGALLPPDVERIIFEEAARADRKTAVTLAVVARRAQIW